MFSTLRLHCVLYFALIRLSTQQPFVEAFLCDNNSAGLTKHYQVSRQSQYGTNQNQPFLLLWKNQGDHDAAHSGDGYASSEVSYQRRKFLLGSVITASTIATAAQPSYAGEVGARITQAVTTSDLGVSVRRSVVRGAQVMDSLDGSWEQFSDRFNLGAERRKLPYGRPKPKVIPDPKPLEANIARDIITIIDQTFMSLSFCSATTLNTEIEKVESLVRQSFFRGRQVDGIDGTNKEITNAEEFNFISYVHFKAYANLILDKKVDIGSNFSSFRNKFEIDAGKAIAENILTPQQLSTFLSTNFKTSSAEEERLQQLKSIIKQIDSVCSLIVDKGLVALIDRSEITDDQIYDWFDDDSNLVFTIALDNDITLGSQMLLQEQGYRLYPNYSRFLLTYLLQQVISSNKVTTEDYYFDPDYNSDPNKFEVREIVVNVVVEA